MDCMKNDMNKKDVTIILTGDRDGWKDKTHYADK